MCPGQIGTGDCAGLTVGGGLEHSTEIRRGKQLTLVHISTCKEYGLWGQIGF